MDVKTDEKKLKHHRLHGLMHFSLFFILIVAGIICKRVFHHPEFMMLFHGPAAVFLVISGMHLTWQHRSRLKELQQRV